MRTECPSGTILYGWVALEELTKSLNRYCGVKTDIEHFVSVTYKLQKLLGRIYVKYNETTSYAVDA